MRIANLPWYDLRDYRDESDRLWRDLARRCRRAGLPDIPEGLDRHEPHDHVWQSDHLLLSQACGYDVVFPHREKLRIVATPVYAAPGCEGPRYRSWIVVAENSPYACLADLRGSRVAINGENSHSGMNGLRSLIAPLAGRHRFFGGIRLSGSHEGSLGLLKEGEADVAAVDCITFEMIRRRRPDAVRGVRILMETEPVPAPPFVTGSRTPPDVEDLLRRVIRESLSDPGTAPLWRVLLIEGIEVLPRMSYESIAASEREAVGDGFREFPHHGFDGPEGG